MEARIKRRIQAGIISKIAQPQRSQMHPLTLEVARTDCKKGFERVDSGVALTRENAISTALFAVAATNARGKESASRPGGF